MGWNDHLPEDDGFDSFIRDLLNYGHLDGAPAGIAKLYLDKGREALSPKQEYVFTKDVVEAHTVEACSRCQSEIKWDEMAEALDNGGYCSYCVHKMSKDDL